MLILFLTTMSIPEAQYIARCLWTWIWENPMQVFTYISFSKTPKVWMRYSSHSPPGKTDLSVELLLKKCPRAACARLLCTIPIPNVPSAPQSPWQAALPGIPRSPFSPFTPRSPFRPELPGSPLLPFWPIGPGLPVWKAKKKKSHYFCSLPKKQCEKHFTLMQRTGKWYLKYCA